jgi:hypothetical protein
MQKGLAGAILLIAVILVAAVFFGQIQRWFNLQNTDNYPTNQTNTPAPTFTPTKTPIPTNKPTPTPYTIAPTPTQTQISTPYPTVTLMPTTTPTPISTPTTKHISYAGDLNVTWDGKWTSNNEWLDAGPYSTVKNFSFRDKMLFSWNDSSVTSVWECILIETADNTIDSSDYWEICIDTLGNAGNAPQVDDFKIVITGHANAAWYRGNGTTWMPYAVPSSDFFMWNNSISTSPSNNATHWICELGFERVGLSISPAFYMKVSVFDGHNGGLGVQSWPSESSADVPNNWGYIDYYIRI